MNLINEDGDISIESIEDTYLDSVYNVSYTNEILHILGDDEIKSFSACIEYSFLSRFKDLYEKKLLFVINDSLVICVRKDNVYDINNMYLKDKKKLYFSDILPEAKEKLLAKYNSYISRLEDNLEKPFEEIING